MSSIFLSLFIYYDIQLFNRLKLSAIEFNMHLYNISGLLCDNVIQLTGEIFGWEAEILSKDHMSEDVLAIAPFNPVLVLARQEFVHSSWLE